MNFSGPNRSYPSDEVKILGGLKLLKMGGIDIPMEKSNQSKHIEFANLSKSTFKGDFHISGELILNYCYLDDIVIENADIGLVTIIISNARNIKIINSKIRQWKLINSFVSGEAINSRIENVNIHGGHWYVNFKDCDLKYVNAQHAKDSEGGFIETYKILKKAYEDQGDDIEARNYFIAERELKRNQLWLDCKRYSRTWHYRLNKNSSLNIVKGYLRTVSNFLAMTLNYYYWGYGRKPQNVIFSSLFFIFFFGICYYLISDISFTESLFVSGATFTTLGYFSYVPAGVVKLLTHLLGQ